MFELILLGERLLVLQGPVSIALVAAVMIGAAASGTALARALKKKFSRLDRAVLIGGFIFGVAGIQLRAATFLPPQSLLATLQWIATLSLGAATASFALAASAAVTRRRVLRLDAEETLAELKAAIAKIETLAAKNPPDPIVTSRLESLRQLSTSIERSLLTAACRAPLDRVLKLRPEIPQSPEKAELALVRVRAHLHQLEEARTEILKVPAGPLAEDALTALDAIATAHKKLEIQLQTHLLRAEVESTATAATTNLRHLHPIPTQPTDLKLAEQIIAATDLTETIAATLTTPTIPLDRALTEAAQKLQTPTTFREVLASLRD